MALEGVEPVAPRHAVGRQPLVDGVERLGPEPVHAAWPGHGDVDEPRLAQHAEVLGHERLAHAERVDELAHGTLPRSKQVEQAPAIGVGHDLEHAGEDNQTVI